MRFSRKFPKIPCESWTNKNFQGIIFCGNFSSLGWDQINL